MMPIVAFFSNQFATKEGHGITRYASQLFQAFQEIENPPDIVPVAAWSNRDEVDLNQLRADTGLRILPTGRRLTPLLWTFLGFPTLENLLNTPVDLVHASSLGYPIATSKPYVVTVHDIGSLTHPQYFSNNPPWIMRKSLNQAIRKAAALICVSQTTSDSLQEYVSDVYKVDLSSRVYVAREGVSKLFYNPHSPSGLENQEILNFLEKPFIFTVGKLSPRKNLEVVIRALKRLGERIPHQLVTVGGDGWDFQATKTLVKESGLEDRIHFLGHVSDEALRVLYAKASCFVFPSLFEGFGLPVLEAMASGCPVVTSNVSSLPEIAGEAALLVNPWNVEEVASAIEAICLDENIAEQLKQKGIKRARMFTWEACAEKVDRIYRQILQGGS